MAHYIECADSSMYNHRMVIAGLGHKQIYEKQRLFDERREWIHQNCSGGYSFENFAYKNVYFYFVEASDSILYKLRWG